MLEGIIRAKMDGRPVRSFLQVESVMDGDPEEASRE